jgi:hypothetical protein
MELQIKTKYLITRTDTKQDYGIWLYLGCIQNELKFVQDNGATLSIPKQPDSFKPAPPWQAT